MTGSEADYVRLEHDVGRDLTLELRRQLKLDPDQQAARLLNDVGSRLVACVAACLAVARGT